MLFIIYVFNIEFIFLVTVFRRSIKCDKRPNSGQFLETNLFDPMLTLALVNDRLNNESKHILGCGHWLPRNTFPKLRSSLGIVSGGSFSLLLNSPGLTEWSKTLLSLWVIIAKKCSLKVNRSKLQSFPKYLPPLAPPATHFQVPNSLFLGYMWVPIPPFSQYCCFSAFRKWRFWGEVRLKYFNLYDILLHKQTMYYLSMVR